MNVFSGKITQSGLSNEKRLVTRCHERFKDTSNSWHLCAGRIYENGAAVSSSWKFISKSVTERRRQMNYLHIITMSEKLSKHEKVSIMAWMLFEMLSECPHDII